TLATSGADLADYALALVQGRDGNPLRTSLLGQAMAIENLRASAAFERRESRNRQDALRRRDIAMLGVLAGGRLLARWRGSLQVGGSAGSAGLETSLTSAATAIQLGRRGVLDATGLRRRLVQARPGLPLARELYRQRSLPDDEIVRRAAAIG